METLKTKLKKQGGFTLIEMLVVVSIIAILVVISVPVVNTSLENARDAADSANERAAKSVTLMHYMGAIDDTNVPNSSIEYDGGYMPGIRHRKQQPENRGAPGQRFPNSGGPPSGKHGR